MMSLNENPLNNNMLLNTTDGLADYVKFTRKNEDYPKEQILALVKAGRLNISEIDRRIFCGIKIQIGIDVVTSFLRKGLQYKSPIRGRSEIVNGSWTGIVKGLTVESNSSISYDLAFGNFLAWDEEFPYIKFGPFIAIESKLVMLTGSSRRIETSSFGTNIGAHVWMAILTLLIILSLLASLHSDWQHTKCRNIEEIIHQLAERHAGSHQNAAAQHQQTSSNFKQQDGTFLNTLQKYLFIYFTMLLNKPSVEFDELIWPKHSPQLRSHHVAMASKSKLEKRINEKNWRLEFKQTLQGNELLENSYALLKKQRKSCRRKFPTSMRVLSYLWSASCLVMASIYSGEMLAVMLLHTDQNIDTIIQLINSKPPIEPVIRQDDFTYTLMLKSLDENMLKLHNKTKIIPRTEVYSRSFIENVSARKYALLGDDELIETIYDTYHKYYPLYKSKMSYLQYPISLISRKDLNSNLELKLRKGIVQMFEMGLIHRWYQAQKDTLIKFYDTYERRAFDNGKAVGGDKNRDDEQSERGNNNSQQKYKPLSMRHFRSFFEAMLYCIVFALIVLALEIICGKLSSNSVAPS